MLVWRERVILITNLMWSLHFNVIAVMLYGVSCVLAGMGPSLRLEWGTLYIPVDRAQQFCSIAVLLITLEAP